MMEKQKTPIALAIEDLKKTKKSIISKNQYAEGYLGALEDFITVLESLKQKEREMFECFAEKIVHHNGGGTNADKLFDETLTQE